LSSPAPISITGCGALGVLGHDLASHLAAVRKPPPHFRPISEMDGGPSEFGNQHAGWIEPRSLLNHRKWSPLSAAAIHVADQALEAAGWSAAERGDTAVFFGTSRGALAGWTEAWPERRPFRLMAASNSLSAEPAAAVGSEFGIKGPWQVQSSGCCSGLDALGMAKLWLDAGLSPRALVIAVDLPLTSAVLQAYADTGILSPGDRGSSITTVGDGMIPAEGAAAVCLEPRNPDTAPLLSSYLSVSEGDDPLGGGAKHPALTAMIERAMETEGMPGLIVAHASGTRAQSLSEPEAIRSTSAAACPLLPLKGWTGHTIGASGLLETALIAGFMRRGESPVADAPRLIKAFKIASSMGGKHSLITLRMPS
jgi:3-oxoacyl-[acyl-carrier-protein] synthase II